MLKLMENSPTSALPPGCTGNISITVIAHLGRNGWAWLLTASHNLIKLSFGSKWVLGIQSCHPVSVRRGSTPLVWVLFVWFCCYCSVFSVFFFWVLFLLLTALSPPHPLPFFKITPPPGHFYALTFPFWSLYSLFLISPTVAAAKLTECFCHAVCLKPWFLLLSYKTKLDVAVGLLFTVYFSLCCTG